LIVALIAHVVSIPERQVLLFLLKIVHGSRRPFRGRVVIGLGLVRAKGLAAVEVSVVEENEQERSLARTVATAVLFSEPLDDDGQLSVPAKPAAHSVAGPSVRRRRVSCRPRDSLTPDMRAAKVERARDRLAQGRSRRSVAREIGVAESILRGWLRVAG
jgi:hypothetical protein